MKKILLIILINFHCTIYSQIKNPSDISRFTLRDSTLYAQNKDDYSYRIDSLLQTTNIRKFNGVVLISKNGKVKYSRALGYSDFERKTPISIGDNFRIQSNSKQVTAVLILKEVEKGTIKLNIPIRKYLPEFHQTWADTVTVRQLLNMSSGVTGLNKPLIFKPGSNFNYSNPAYGILGQILEKVTDEQYTKLANKLFKKLKMRNSYCYEIDKTNIGLINGYINKNNSFTKVAFNSLGFTKESWNEFLPAGGIISNAKDLNTWDKKLHEGKILQKETYEAMVNSNVIDIHDAFSDDKIKYGYGVNINEKNPIRYIGHAGRGIGFVSLKFYVPEKNLDVIILENVYNDNINIIYHFEKKIRKIVLNSSLIKL